VEDQSLKSFFETGKKRDPLAPGSPVGTESSSLPFPLDETQGYELSPAYRSQVRHLSPGTGLSLIINRKDRVELIPVREAPVGWRIRVDEFILHFPVKAGAWASERDSWEAANRMHHRLLSLGVYRPGREELLAYWQEADHGPEEGRGFPDPEAKDRGLYLVGLVERCCPEVWSALELGCGLGLSLSLLKSKLGIRVAGIEVNRCALELGRVALPNLTGSRFHCADFQEQMAELVNDSFELIFSLSALMYLHPSVTDEFWTHLVRVAAKYLITVEDEERTSYLSWPRSYRQLLEGHGARQIHWEPVPEKIPGMAGFTARVFAV